MFWNIFSLKEDYIISVCLCEFLFQPLSQVSDFLQKLVSNLR